MSFGIPSMTDIDFSAQIDSILCPNGSKQSGPQVSATNYPDPDDLVSTCSISPYPSSQLTPAQGSFQPQAQTQNLLRETSRWTSCDPSPGFAKHPSRPQREASKWVPCSPPPGMPKYLPRQRPEVLRWTPCSPPSGQPAHIPRSRSNITQTKELPTPLAPLPFINPKISERLGLQRNSKDSAPCLPTPPRSTAADSVPTQWKPMPLDADTIDQYTKEIIEEIAPIPTPDALPNLNRGFPDGLPVAGSGLFADPASASPTPSSSPRRGSIHLEDLCDSDEDSDCGISSLLSVSSSPIELISHISHLQNGKGSKSPKGQNQRESTKKRRLLAEIQDTQEFLASRAKECDNGNEDEDPIIIGVKRRRGTNDDKAVMRRSVRQKRSVASYAE